MGRIADWSKSLPSSTSSVSETDDLLRSHWSILESAVEEEHFFKENSGISTGVHKLGSGRPHLGTYSQVSTASDLGRIMIDSDYSRFWYVGSDDTIELGGSQAGNVAGVVEGISGGVLVFNSGRSTIGDDTSPGFTADIAPSTGIVNFQWSAATVVNAFRSYRIATVGAGSVVMKSRNSMGNNTPFNTDIDFIMIVQMEASEIS